MRSSFFKTMKSLDVLVVGGSIIGTNVDSIIGILFGEGSNVGSGSSFVTGSITKEEEKKY